VRLSRASGGGRASLVLDAEEATLIGDLAGQLVAVLDAADARDGGGDRASRRPVDPVLTRLLPDAYPSDAEASREFRRFTASELTSLKVENARRVMADVTREPAEIPLDDLALGSWLRVLTDIRLALAMRLGMDARGEIPHRARPSDEHEAVLDVYDWLGYLQESLVAAATGE